MNAGPPVALAIVLASGTPIAQTPQPFPQPNQQPSQPPAGTAQPPRPAAPPPSSTSASQAPAGDVPTDATLGVQIFPSAQFITSYDAGRGQRFYLFGTATPFTEIVAFYRNVLKQKGDVLFESPPTHQFDIGRFRDETMAFPPSVTVKDYTWGGSAGYPNPKKGAGPERFPTVIQIVPAPAGTPPG